MLDIVLPFIKDDSVVTLPPYQTFLKEQAQFIKHKEDQFIASSGHESNAIRLLRYMFNFIDWGYMDNQVNNIDRYMYHVRFIRNNLNNIFDKATRGSCWTNVFFHKTDKCKVSELLVPIEDTNCLINLPLTTDNWKYWKRTKPVYIWTHDSNEFTCNLLNDRISFYKHPPNYAVILIDVVALVMKYYIWYKYQRPFEEAQELVLYIPQQYFLHKYVFNNLIWDMCNIWIINQLKKMMNMEYGEDMDIFDNKHLQVENQYGRISSGCKRGLEYLYGRLHYIKNFRPESILSSKLLFNGSINKRIRLITSNLDTIDDRQHEYIRWLRDKDMLKLFLQIWKLRSDAIEYKNIIRYVSREYKYILNHRPWNICQNLKMQKEIQNQIENFSVFLD